MTAFWVFERVAEVLRYAPGVEVVSRAEMFGDSKTDLGRKLDACGTDVGCSGALLRGAGIAIGLEVVINLSLQPALVSTHLVDARSGSLLGFEFSEVSLGEAAPGSAAESAIGAAIQRQVAALLERSGRVVAGRIVVQTEPPEAQVTVDGDPPGATGPPAVFVLAPGAYEVRVCHPGYVDAEMNAQVASATDTQLDLQLEAVSIWRSPWIWIAAGVIAAGAGVGLYFALRPESELAICHTPDPALCPN